MVFREGNPGRPKGALNKRTLEMKAVESQILEAWNSQIPGKLPLILDAAIAQAGKGNFSPLQTLLPYIARKMPEEFKHSGIQSEMSAKEFLTAIVDRIRAQSQIPPDAPH